MSISESRVIMVAPHQWATFVALLANGGCDLNELPKHGRYRAYKLQRPEQPGRLEHSLTDREFEVLRGMARGDSNREIGVKLHLSEDTVKTYARRLFKKLAVRDRAQAVDRGHQVGLLGSR